MRQLESGRRLSSAKLPLTTGRRGSQSDSRPNRFRRAMKRNRSISLFAVTLLASLASACDGWAKSAAHEDSYPVWMALLEGFDGDAFYIGSDDTYSYFRLGHVFRSYYKVPTCAAKLPQTLPLDSGRFYAVRLHIQADNSIRVTKGCSNYDGYEFGELDRK